MRVSDDMRTIPQNDCMITKTFYTLPSRKSFGRLENGRYPPKWRRPSRGKRTLSVVIVAQLRGVPPGSMVPIFSNSPVKYFLYDYIDRIEVAMGLASKEAMARHFIMS